MAKKLCIGGLLVLGCLIALNSAMPTTPKSIETTRDPDPGQVCPLWFMGTMVTVGECRLWVYCKDGHGEVHKCDKRTVFDPTRGKCVPPEEYPHCEEGGFLRGE